jgi:hypothetical protein
MRVHRPIAKLTWGADWSPIQREGRDRHQAKTDEIKWRTGAV